MDASAEWHEHAKTELVESFLRTGASETVRVLDDAFKESMFALSDLFTEARRRILGLITEERLARFEGVYKELYEESRPLMAFMRQSEVPVPPAIVMAAEYTLLKELGDLLTRARVDPVPERAFDIARDLDEMDLAARAGEYELLLREAAEARAIALKHDPLGPDLDQLHRLLDLGAALGVAVNLWEVQNTYHDAALDHRDDLLARPQEDTNRVAEFRRLGERLYFNLDSLRAAVPTPG